MKTGTAKHVRIEASLFDCLPGHVVIVGNGNGSSLRVAAGRAMESVMGDDKIKGRRVHSFKCTVSVTSPARSDNDPKNDSFAETDKPMSGR